MANIDWKRKFSSRKLWAAISGIVTGLVMVFGLDENTITTTTDNSTINVTGVLDFLHASDEKEVTIASGSDAMSFDSGFTETPYETGRIQ